MGDTSFTPAIGTPSFGAGRGPLVYLDEAHRNFHTIEGRYGAFARLLGRDGYVVRALRAPFSARTLAPARILVIANASAPDPPGAPLIPSSSAFTDAEIEAVRAWVTEGGSLLLIADHFPFAGAAARLAESLGVLFVNGFATDERCGADEFRFRRADGTLRDDPITRGRTAPERVDSVLTITGQAFRVVVPGARPLLVLPPRTVVLLPTEPWTFTAETPRIPGEGLLQGAAFPLGRGLVAVFGEAAMFSAQVSGPARRPMGMNQPEAPQNARFLLNVMRWLAR